MRPRQSFDQNFACFTLCLLTATGLIGAKRHRVPNDPRKTSDCRAGGTAKPHGVDEFLLPDDRARQNSLSLRCPQPALGRLLIFRGSTSRNSPPWFGSVRGCCVGAS